MLIIQATCLTIFLSSTCIWIHHLLTLPFPTLPLVLTHPAIHLLTHLYPSTYLLIQTSTIRQHNCPSSQVHAYPDIPSPLTELSIHTATHSATHPITIPPTNPQIQPHTNPATRNSNHPQIHPPISSPVYMLLTLHGPEKQPDRLLAPTSLSAAPLLSYSGRRTQRRGIRG